MIKNNEIREAANNAGVFLWQIADKLNMQDSNFSRLLRKELSPKKKEQILSIIEELKKENE